MISMYGWRTADAEVSFLMDTRFKILEHFRRWSEEIKALAPTHRRRDFFAKELPGLLKDKDLFAPVLKAMADGERIPDVGKATMFESEVVLYRDPGRSFSVRFYLWGPGEYDPVHDHNSWGVIGTALGTLDIVNYRRIDDASDERHAVLEECSRQFIPIGETYSVFPLNKGIHKTGNAGEPAIVQVGVYGENMTGRTFVNIFDIRTHEVTRLYLPHAKKRILARQALDSL